MTNMENTKNNTPLNLDLNFFSKESSEHMDIDMDSGEVKVWVGEELDASQYESETETIMFSTPKTYTIDFDQVHSLEDVKTILKHLGLVVKDKTGLEHLIKED